MIPAETIPAGPLPGGDAARLVLLRRVGGAVGDEMLAQLQPILLVQEVLLAALARSAEAGALREHASLIKPAVQRAMAACAAGAEWLLPQPGARTSSAELAAECAALLRPEFTLRGVQVDIAAAGAAEPIDRARGRTMLCALLAHAADGAPGPARIRVELEHRPGVCELRISCRPSPAEAALDFLQPQHAPMTWQDLLALAQLEGATLRREGDETIVLVLADAVAGA